jgi:hypothetical protein
LFAHAPDDPFSGLFPAGWFKLDLIFDFNGSISQAMLFFQLGCFYCGIHDSPGLNERFLTGPLNNIMPLLLSV